MSSARAVPPLDVDMLNERSGSKQVFSAVSEPSMAPRAALPATAGLERYTGPWDRVHAAHLLRRAVFGPTAQQIAAFAAMTMDDAIAALFAGAPALPEPLGYGLSDPSNPNSARRIYAWSEYTPQIDQYYRAGLKAWWLGAILSQGTTLHEKMTLFWHNHFVSELSTVLNVRYMYKQNLLFRAHVFGDFKQLTKEVTSNPAMLVYLNGNSNTKGTPNENYGRELQELFTIGKGPEISAGNYTTYTEQDVREAARVLTGWRDDRTTGTSSFNAALHDTGDKTFSPAYQNTVIKGRTGAAGVDELDDLLTMIFAQDATARFICRKIYRWFVYSDIDAAVDAAVITPMAALLRASNWNVRPVLEALFASAHFHAPEAIGCMIKDPIEFIAGTLKRFGVPMPDPAGDQLNSLNVQSNLLLAAASIQMDLFDPPNVAGWPEYYQVPGYYELWINSMTLPTRGGLTDSLVAGRRVGSYTLKMDVLAMAAATSDPSNAHTLIAELADTISPISLTLKQQDYILQNVFIPGLPDYEWTAQWNDYLSNPTNTQKKQVVTQRLGELAKFLLRLAEYQLM